MVIENLDISVFRLFYVKAKCNITSYQSIIYLRNVKTFMLLKIALRKLEILFGKSFYNRSGKHYILGRENSVIARGSSQYHLESSHELW